MSWAQHIGFRLLLGAVLTLTGCKKPGAPDCVKALGKITSEQRPLEPFDRVEVEGRINVRLVADSADYALLTYGEAVIEGLETVVENQTLYLRETNGCDWVRNQSVIPEFEVHHRSLRSIYSESSGTVSYAGTEMTPYLQFEVFDAAGSANIDFHGDSLSVVVHTGATDVLITGTAQHAYYYNAGYGPLDASGCVADEVSVRSQGTGDMFVHAINIVYYQLFDWADIFVYGDPEIKKWHHDGTGEVIRVTE